MLRSDMGRHKMLSFSSKTRGRNVLYKRTLYVGLIAQLTMISSNKVQLIMPIIGWIYEKLFEIRAVRSWDCEKFEIGIKVGVEIVPISKLESEFRTALLEIINIC